MILADEPTGNLDSRESADVFTLLQELQAEGLTLVTITHDQRIADRAARVLRVEDGMLVEHSGASPTYLDGAELQGPTTAPGTPPTGAVVPAGGPAEVPSIGLAALGLAPEDER